MDQYSSKYRPVDRYRLVLAFPALQRHAWKEIPLDLCGVSPKRLKYILFQNTTLQYNIIITVVDFKLNYINVTIVIKYLFVITYYRQ